MKRGRPLRVLSLATSVEARRQSGVLGFFVLWLTSNLLAALLSTAALLFYVFFEAMLIPMFLIIGMWGGPNRIYATIKFFLYTLLGSLLMLVALVYLYFQSGGSFSIADLQALKLGHAEQIWLFLAFFVAFAVKIPMFPVHTWLPDAHVEAPTGLDELPERLERVALAHGDLLGTAVQPRIGHHTVERRLGRI